jgi:hypothetical protein
VVGEVRRLGEQLLMINASQINESASAATILDKVNYPLRSD